jgi:hypothetical protein
MIGGDPFQSKHLISHLTSPLEKAARRSAATEKVSHGKCEKKKKRIE